MNLSIDHECTPFEHIALYHDNPMNDFNRIFSIFLLIVGILGNALGLYFAILSTNYFGFVGRRDDLPSGPMTKARNSVAVVLPRCGVKKLSLNEYLLSWFFGINLINTILLIPSPIIELNVDGSYDLKWKSWAWINYRAHVHFPLTKTLVCFGFLIYVLYFANQMIAIIKPFEYRRIINMSRINVALILCFTYALTWFIPIYRWFFIIELSLCPGPDGTWNQFLNLNYKDMHPNSNKSITSVIVYTYRASAYTWDEGSKWHLYQIFRELFVLILPFLGILFSKFMVLRRSIKAAPWLAIIGACQIVPSYALQAPERRATQCATNGNDTISSRSNRKLAESLQHKRTFVVLTIEFFILLLPVSINQTLMNFWPSKFHHHKLAMVYVSMLLIQAIYVSCTFFINLSFNKYYRSYILKIWRSKQ